jgi:putative aldouronate transport system permease protein
MKLSAGEKIFKVLNVVFMCGTILMFFLPYWYIFIASFSDELSLLKNGYQIIPENFSLAAYKFVFSNNTYVVSAIKNSVFVTITGTFLSVLVCSLVAYPLSKKNLIGYRFFNFYVIFTMLFSGGLVPFYLVVIGLGLYNSLWAVILPGIASAWNIILFRNFFAQIPDSLEEACCIDGASHFKVFTKIILPLSKPVLATITLFAAVGNWNNWYLPMLFIQDKEKMPVQFLIRELLSSFDQMMRQSGVMIGGGGVTPQESVKMAAIIIASLPIIMVYPFLQKYFINGIILGSVKE